MNRSKTHHPAPKMNIPRVFHFAHQNAIHLTWYPFIPCIPSGRAAPLSKSSFIPQIKDIQELLSAMLMKFVAASGLDRPSWGVHWRATA